MKGIVVNFMFVIFVLSCAYGTVEVFSNYNTVLSINTTENTITVEKVLSLKNVYDVGIVPGQIEFKIAKGVDGSVDNLQILNVSAKDGFDKDINVHIRNTQEYSVVVLDIYYPLLPGFEYDFTLNYKLSYDPSGIFFKSLSIPLRESTIPIEKGNFEVRLPQNYHFTYLGGMDGIDLNGNIAKWDIKDNDPNSIVFEYSWIPLRLGFIKGSYAFWIFLNLILLIVLYFEIKREMKSLRKHKDG